MLRLWQSFDTYSDFNVLELDGMYYRRCLSCITRLLHKDLNYIFFHQILFWFHVLLVLLMEILLMLYLLHISGLSIYYHYSIALIHGILNFLFILLYPKNRPLELHIKPVWAEYLIILILFWRLYLLLLSWLFNYI